MASGTPQHTDPQQRELLRVCRIGRAQGLKGEVTIRSFTDEPERRFAPDATLFTQNGDHAYTVAASRTFKGRWIIRLADIENRDDAEAINGLELYAEADDPDLLADEDAWYPNDLIGLEARLDGHSTLRSSETPNSDPDSQGQSEGRRLGIVVDVIDGPAQSLLKIRLAAPYTTEAERTALVPFVEQLVPTIDPTAGYLTIDPPGGLIPGLH